MRSVWYGCCLAVVAAATATAVPAEAGTLRVSPRVSLEETVTDNALLLPNGEADLVSTPEIGVNVQGKGGRAELSADYLISYDHYLNHPELNGYRQRLLGVGKADLIRERLTFDARASLSRQNLAEVGPATATDRTSTRDTTQILNYSLSPKYTEQFGNWVTTKLTYSFDQVIPFDEQISFGRVPTPTSQLDEGTRHKATAEVTSGPVFTDLEWTLTGLYDLSFTNGSRRRVATLDASTEYHVTRWLGLLLRGGLDDVNDSQIVAGDVSGPYWFAGAHLQPTRQIDFKLSTGRRYDGQAWSGSFTYRPSPRTRILASYDVALQTQQEALANNLDRLEITDDGMIIDTRTGLPLDPNDLATALVNTTFVARSFALGISGAYARTSYGLTFRHTEREYDISTGGSDTSMSITGTLKHSLTRRTTGSAAATYATTSGGTTAAATLDSTSLLLSVSLAHALTPKATGELRYSHLRNDSNVTYKENALVARVAVSF